MVRSIGFCLRLTSHFAAVVEPTPSGGYCEPSSRSLIETHMLGPGEKKISNGWLDLTPHKRVRGIR